MALETIEISRSEIQGAELFPLPLVAIEKFMLWDEAPGYPMTFRISLEFDGHADTQAMLEAFRLTVKRHAMLCVNAAVHRQSNRWELPDSIRIPFYRHGDFEHSPFPTKMDLQREPGIRFWYQNRETDFILTLEIHHAVSDGLRVKLFLIEWMANYDELVQHREIRTPPKKIEPQRLVKRGEFVRTVSQSTRPTSLWEKLIHGYHFHFRGPDPLYESNQASAIRKNGNSNQGSDYDVSEVCGAVLELEESLVFHESARLRGISTNDLFVGLLAHAAYRWNESSNRKSTWQRTRILIPTVQRATGELLFPASNRLGLGFVSLDRAQASEDASAVSASGEQLRMIQKLQLGLDFVQLFDVASRMERMTKRLMRMRRCMATAILSNLGDVSKAFVDRRDKRGEEGKTGGLKFKRIFGAPPIRPLTEVAIGVCRTNDRFSITCRTAVGREFFDLYLETLRDWVAKQRSDHEPPGESAS